jgi:carbamoylphosphate synthase large subunit|tara:strand:- start:3329 stop:4234 length:906 start_codon:yes stop_codon:yes gene_type:complete
VIIIIHENKEWISPFEEAFNALHLEHEFWYVPSMNLNLQDVPPKAVYYNRMSASSHTRDHRYEPELAIGILEWLERHSRIVVNGSRALDLEISKIRQYQELEKYKILTPKTFATARIGEIVKGADKINFPLISKHNRAGKGLGVYRFDDKKALKEFTSSKSFESSPDGINLLQQYIYAPSNTIIRMEFVNAKFIYAVEVDTSEGFELCPADECQIDSNCPTGTAPKFTILNDFKLKNLSTYEAFLRDNNIGIAGIEIIIDEDGVVWTYDVNTNTNYNSAAEEEANESAPLKIAEYLFSLQP